MRQALLCLNNLAANEINHASMINRGIMKILSKAFESPENDIREYAAFIIANMCSNPDHLVSIGSSGGIKPLIMISKSLNVNTQCFALAALRRLGKFLMIYICNFHVLNHLLCIYICKTPLESQYDVRMSGKFLMIYICNFHVLNHLLCIYICKTPLESQYDVRIAGKFLMIYICNFHVLNHLLLIYICKLHWNVQRISMRIGQGLLKPVYSIHLLLLAFQQRLRSRKKFLLLFALFPCLRLIGCRMFTYIIFF